MSCDYHDSAAALCVDGVLVAAIEEERLSRVKHDASLPERAIAACLAIGGLVPDDLDAVVFYEKPLNVFGRFMATRQRVGPRSWSSFVRDVPSLVGTNLMIGDRLDRALRTLGATRTIPVSYCEHHLSHAAAAFFPSPFETAATLTIDGVGEWATASIGRGSGRRVAISEEVRFPSSLGLLYSLMTEWCGFRANDGEYKLMGLAPFGEPRFEQVLGQVLQLHDGGGFSIDAAKVRRWAVRPERMRWLCGALDGPPLASGDALTQREADIAASIQVLTERAVVALAGRARDLTGERSLCLAGGVALNCVANGTLVDSGLFDDVWIQPAAGDAGSAIGAALWFDHRSVPRVVGPGDGMRGAALGPSFSTDEIVPWLVADEVEHRVVDDEGELLDEVASRLADGQVVAWFQGAMEFGPRALGHRSILADPRSPTMQQRLNLQIKGRESFRPFAPAVLLGHVHEWFELDGPSPYMLRTAAVSAVRRQPVGAEPAAMVERVQVVRSDIPACTHIDGSARVQTVDPAIEPRFHALLESFLRQTGCPVLLNTSFNVADEPIVCTPEHALDTARRAGVDLLVLEDVLIDLTAAS